MNRFAILLVVVALMRVSAPINAQQSLAEIASRERERRQSIPSPARIYTNEDLVGSSRPAEVDRASGQAQPPISNEPSLPDPRYAFPPIPAECLRADRAIEPSQIVRETFKCPDGISHIKWTNEKEGTTWRQAYRPDGSQYGVNRCGVRWTLYAVPERTYLNSKGERRDGITAERAIADAEIGCARDYQRAQQPELPQQASPQTTVIILERPQNVYPAPPPVPPPPSVKPPSPPVPGGTIIPCETPPSGDPKRDAQVAALCRGGAGR